MKVFEIPTINVMEIVTEAVMDEGMGGTTLVSGREPGETTP